MRARGEAALRLQKMMLVASIGIPAALFSYAGWVNYWSLAAHTDEQLTASLNIVAVHANKIFQAVDLTFTSVDALIGDLSDEQIRASEQDLHVKLAKLDEAVASTDTILVADKDGRVLISAAVYPAGTGGPAVADRDYFLAQKDHDADTYVGTVLQARVRKGDFFAVSRRRASRDGEFNGVVMVALVPKVFSDFYRQLADGSATSFSLARRDGSILARYPAPPGAVTRFGPDSGFMHTIPNRPEGGFVTAVSLEGVERRIDYRPLGYGDLYASAGLPTEVTAAAWLRAMASHLVFGVPATVVLFALVLATMGRTRELYAEAARRETAEQALRQAQKMEAVGQLTGGVAHDFNNLLTIIIGNIGIAKRGVVESRAERALTNALAGAERAAQLTQRLLAFSRLQPLNPKTVDANKLILSMSDLLTRSLGENIELETISGAGLWRVEADTSELEATLLNLALNARDAMPDGGKLTIETSNAYLDDDYCRQNGDMKPGQYVLIAVSDNGVGMPASTLERVFEPFFTTKETGKGTGLGLSQVYGFIRQSGGHVKIYSELGQGTSIKLYLPRHDGEEAAVVEQAAPTGAEQGRGETILIVEDDEGVRQYASEILRDLNYQIIEAKDSASALRLLEADKAFDLLLTDVVLPGKNGRELADEVLRRRPGVKVIFMTGYSRNAIVHQGRLDRGAELISKPLIEGVVARKIRQVLDAS
jgi:signal transduction histidine kinase